jgi:hypothetical protein
MGALFITGVVLYIIGKALESSDQRNRDRRAQERLMARGPHRPDEVETAALARLDPELRAETQARIDEVWR